jgi:tetratricopeptide (TPR) repeat protein
MEIYKSVVRLLIAVLVVGCGSKQKEPESPVQKLSETDVNEMSAEHSKFEHTKDPPFSAQTRYAAGQLAESRGDPQTALKQYKAALETDPKHRPSLYALGLLQTQLRQYNDAAGTWQNYIKATNGDGESYNNLAFCYELAGKNSEAEATYKKGIQAAKGSDVCRINYGLMLARLNRENEAITQLSAVLKPAEVHYNLGSVYEQMRQKDRAKAEYNKALELDPDLRDAKARLATMR